MMNDASGVLRCPECNSVACQHVTEYITRHADAPLVDPIWSEPYSVTVLCFASVKLPFTTRPASMSAPVVVNQWSDDPMKNQFATATWELAPHYSHSETPAIGGIITPFEGRRIIRNEILNTIRGFIKITPDLHRPLPILNCSTVKLKGSASHHDTNRNLRLYEDRRYALADSLYRYIYGICLLCHSYGNGGIENL